jgi:general secretion pathway protein I
MTRRGEAGFTLIETLVALAVLAVSAVAILGATEAHVARVAALEARAAAQWAAENRLVEEMLGLPGGDGETLIGIAVAVTVARSDTADPDLARLRIAAAVPPGGPVLARLDGFALRPLSVGGAGP